MTKPICKDTTNELLVNVVGLRQQLDQTRKALDVAKRSLEDCEKILKADRKDWGYLTAEIALKQIEQIMAPEQKD